MTSEKRLQAARESLRAYSSVGAAVSDLAATLQTDEGEARRLIARAARTEVAKSFQLDADEVSRLFRMGVTVK